MEDIRKEANCKADVKANKICRGNFKGRTGMGQ